MESEKTTANNKQPKQSNKNQSNKDNLYSKQFNQKYAPNNTSEIVGQDEQLRIIKKSISEYKKNKKKAILIYGPSGTGKTSTIYALAKELDLEIIEVNASDSRNAESLENRIVPAIKQQSLFGKKKIILIDEIDGISGSQDRGGIPSILKIIEESPYPIIMTANDPWDQKFNSLRSKSILVQYDAISTLAMISKLKDICKKEGIEIDDDALLTLSRKNQGDLRSAINDLENIAGLNEKITKEHVNETSEREREETIINALLKIFKTKDPEIALTAFNNVEEDIDKIFLWIDENLSKEYKNEESLAKAYTELSDADVLFGRIRRWQYYRFYAYIYEILSVGVALSKKEKNPSYIKYSPSSRILKMWIINQKNLRKKSVASKISSYTHTSLKRSLTDMPYIKLIAKNNTILNKLASELKLSDEEIEWLKK
ncbi:MAG: ATPase AAA [Candidatus Woesearchaeota archaeon]|nr:MAG: ATPase AAA [Candidatus Woesearchaeota archaeon]